MSDNSPQLPEKEFYSIGEVAKRLGVEAYTIRYWQKEFNLKIPTKPNGRRVFTLPVILVLEKIKKLRYQDKLQIDGVKNQLKQDTGNPVIGRQEVPQIIYPQDDPLPPPAQPQANTMAAPPLQTNAEPTETPGTEKVATLLQQKRQDREQKYVIDELKKIRDILSEDLPDSSE